MQVNITGHHVEVTPALRHYVEDKLQRMERHFDHVIDCHVILTLEKLTHKAEATVHAGRKDIFADAAGPDMYAAIDGLADKLDRQVRRYKDKLKDHHKDGSARDAAADES